METFEARCVLSGVPQLIELNAAGASNPTDFVQVGSTVYFTADTGTTGVELWKTDGTSSGTSLVKDLRPGTESSSPEQLTAFNGQLYFVANDGQSGQELWKTDGTASGTVLVRDIHPGQGYQYPYGYGNLQSFPRGLVALNGALLISAEDATNGAELWRTDGTQSGTVLVKDIAPGTDTNTYGTYPKSSNPQGLAVVNSTLYFTADDGTNGRELWKSDGTATGTVLVKDIFPGSSPYTYEGNDYGEIPDSSRPAQLTAVNGTLFFTATDGEHGIELWKSDGTAAGTVMIKDIQPGVDGSFNGDNALLAVGNRLYFTPENDASGKELWISDGTESGTVLVKDVRTGTVGAISKAYLAELSGKVYFAADEGVNGTELWRTDGTSAGTTLVTNLDGSSSGAFPRYLTAVNGRLYFSAFTATSGRELWESDGTAANTKVVSDLLAGTGSSSPRDLFGFDQSLLFSADNGTNGRELYSVAAIGDTIEARLTIYVDGERVTIPANIGVNTGGTPVSQIRSVGANGNLLIQALDDEPLSALTLGDFFDTWRTNAGQAGNNTNAVFSPAQLLNNTIDATNQIQMFVNGQISHRYDDYEIRSGDEIVLVYGQNPVVALNTNFGALIFELFEAETPGTVDNFLNYVNDGDYINTFFHRSVPGFVIQGGGFGTTSVTFTNTAQFSAIPTDPTIQNEPGISNLRGTVAMAKLGGDPNSATSQFFVNLSDSNTFLDTEANNRFTVFAQVLDMTVADAIEDLPVNTTNGSPYGELPLSSTNQLVVIQAIEGVGTVAGTKFVDADADGVFDATETGLAGVTIFVDANNNNQFDAGETSTTTDTSGNYRLQLEPGSYKIQATLGASQLATVPTGGQPRTVTVEIGRDLIDQDFGETALAAPTSLDLLAGFDTGTSNSDNLTRLNNSATSQTLQFAVAGVVNGATVRIFSDGELIGSGTAAAGVATITTDGSKVLSDGLRNITATQEVQGSVSSVSAALSITIDTALPAPISNSAPTVTPFGQLYTFDANSPGDSTVTYALADAPTGMTIDAQTGVLSWTPTLVQAVPQRFQVQTVDAAGNAAATTVDLTVLGEIPAQPDSYAATEDTTLTVIAAQGVLANDGSEGTGSLTATLVANASSGTVTLNADGSFTYVPNSNFFGTDSFTYRATDGTDDTNVARVTIQVAGVNDPSITVADSYTAVEDTALTINAAQGVLANDSDPDSTSLTVSLANQPTHGTIVLNADGSFVYTPTANYAGPDSFAYRVNDGTNVSEPVTVTLTVSAVNDVPLAVADSYTVNEDAVLSVAAANGVLANDTDPDGNLTVSVAVPPAQGTLTLNSDGSFTYTPSANFAGTDSFTYSARDGVNTTNATVTLTVVEQPDPPTAQDDTLTAVDTGSPQVLNVLANDTSGTAGQSPTLVSASTGSQGGTAVISNGTLLYSPAAGFRGTETFSYTVQNSAGLTDTATVTVSVTDASSNSIAGLVYLDANNNRIRDTSEVGIPGAQITLTGTSTAGEAISRSLLTQSNGEYKFENLPSGTYALSETQPTALADGQDATTVTGATAGNDQITNLVVGNGQSLTGNLFGETRLHANYTSIAWFFASSTSTSELFRETLAMSEEKVGKTALATAIRQAGTPPTPPPPASNTLPVAVADQYSTPEGTPLSVTVANGVLNNDTDVNQDPLTASLVSSTTHGTLVLSANGSFTYTPAAGFVGSDSFSYTAKDAQGNSNPVVVTLNVTDDPNTFNLAENSPTGTTVGRLSSSTASGTLSFELADSTLASDLKLRPDDHLTGNAAAPVVLIEYLDLQCPVCQTFHPIVKQLEDEFAGDLLVVRRHLPLNTPHPNAFEAAIVAEAAGRQGKFDAMVDLMFEKQDDWEALADPTPVFQTYAQQLSLNMTQFAQDIADAALTARVQRDADAAGRLSAAATPTFFLNGQQLDNADAQDDFEELIEDALDEVNRPFTIDRQTGDIRVADGNQLNFEATASYTLQINGTNAAGTSTPFTVKINLTNVNESAPVAFTDTYTLTQGGTLIVNPTNGVLKNDTDADADPLTAALVTNVTSGTLTLNADGSFNYVPNTAFSGTDSFTYQSSDGTRNSNVASVTINVTGLNAAPVGVSDAYTVTEDTPLTVAATSGVLANDQDAEGATLTATLVASPTHGTISLNANGGFTYTPAAAYTGPDSFTYQASDGGFSSAVTTVSLTVAPTNDLPVAANDSYSTTEDTPLTIAVAQGVLANDQDADANSLTAQLRDQPLHGTVTLNSNGSFSYTPTANFSGTDLFTYVARDAVGDSNLATVSITVAPVNDLPQAVNDSYSTRQGTTLTVATATGLLANDTDADGNSLTATVVTDAAHGTLTLNANGAFQYVPDAGYTGPDSFTYRASDGTGVSNSATVAISVTTVNTFSLLENAANGAVVGQLELLDSDIGEPLIFEVVDSQLDARLRLAADDHLKGDPAAAAVLIEYLDFQCPSCATYHPIVRQLEADFAGELLVVRRHLPLTSIHPNALNAAIAAEAAGRQNKFDEMADLLFEKQSEWQDATNPRPMFETYASQLGLNATQFTTDLADPATLARVQRDLTAATGLGASATPTFYLDGVAVSSLPTNLSEFSALVQTNLDQASDTFAVNRRTGQILLRDRADLDFDAQPTLTLNVRVTDSEGDSEVLVATINLIDVDNAAPVGVADSYTLTEDQVLTVGAATGILANDTDADSDPLVPRVETNPLHGTLVVNTNGSFTYTPNADFSGTDSFAYHASDGVAESALTTVTLTVTNINDAPTAVADTYSVNENFSLAINAATGVLANDTDPDGDTLSVAVVDQTTHGTLTANPNGSFTYSPQAGFSGTDTFTYRVSDGQTTSADVATVTITVNHVNRAPVAVADQYALTAGTILAVVANDGVLANDSDPDADTLIATVQTSTAHGTLLLAGNGAFQYTPTAGFVGTDSFSYLLNDGALDSDEVTVTLIVSPANTFNLAENSRANTLVGQVASQSSELGSSRIYEIVDATLDPRLELAVDDHISGDRTAPVVLIEYLDFQCPSCRAYHPVVDQLEDDFAGELLVVRRHFPLTSIHPNAFAAGVAAEAAGRQGKFLEFGDLLFTNQDDWEAAADPQSFFEQYATGLSLDLTQFRSDQADPALTARVQRDLDTALALGSNATPTFYLQGDKLTTLPATLPEFVSVVQAEVNQVDAAFALDRTTGELLVRDATALDYEISPTRNVVVRVRDLDGTVETIPVTINLIDINDQPESAVLGWKLVDEALQDEEVWFLV